MLCILGHYSPAASTSQPRVQAKGKARDGVHVCVTPLHGTRRTGSRRLLTCRRSRRDAPSSTAHASQKQRTSLFLSLYPAIAPYCVTFARDRDRDHTACFSGMSAHLLRTRDTLNRASPSHPLTLFDFLFLLPHSHSISYLHTTLLHHVHGAFEDSPCAMTRTSTRDRPVASSRTPKEQRFRRRSPFIARVTTRM